MAINKVIYGGNTLIDLTQDTVTASDMLSGVTAHSANGELIGGTIINNGDLGGTITTRTGSYTIPSGYTNGGTVAVNVPLSTITSSALNLNYYLENDALFDYGIRANITIPEGYYMQTTLSKDLSVMLPDLSNAADASNILNGYQAYTNSGMLLTGTMPNIGAVSETIAAGDTYIIPAGYHNGTGTITAADGGGSIVVVYANGGGNTSSVYNSAVLDVGEVGNPCYYQFGGGGGNSKTFSIQGSQTGTSGWKTIESTYNNANRMAGITGSDSEYRYYRLHINSGTASVTNGYRGMMACIDKGGDNSTNNFSPIEETI